MPLSETNSDVAATIPAPTAGCVVLPPPVIVKPAEVDRDKTGGDHQAVGVGGRGEIIDELIGSGLINRAAFLDLERSFFSCVCSRAGQRREDHRPKGERNWKKGCRSSHAVLADRARLE
jgi:hypothetical protein